MTAPATLLPILGLASLCCISRAAWQPTVPREPAHGEIAVGAPGNCDRSGATYILINDISAPTSALFLGEGVTLDLNGHTLTYAAGYPGVANCGFEDGLRGWDVSGAPGAEAKEMPLHHPLVGRKVCILPQGGEIVSPYVSLPVAQRAYYAMVAVADHQTVVDVHVEDAGGRDVECAYQLGDRLRPCCPERNRSPKLGGGVVFALVFGQPAGDYRIRVRAVKGDCVIDDVDIRPAMDVGIGIVGGTMPWAYYQCILDGDGCAFFDYTKPGAPGEPVDGVPHVGGAGVIRVRNGVIRLGSKAIRTWGLQSTAKGVRLELENVRFEASGINTHAVDAPSARINNCRFETDTPWIIDRHRQQDYPVALTGGSASEVSGCEFIGGQGQLSVRGAGSRIFDNLLVNRQTVVNHYSLGAGGEGTQVFRNRILPEQGSGILIGRERGVDVFDNEIRVEASPPVNEYHQADYSVSAVRMTDYNAQPGDPKGICVDNRIHHNRISVTGRRFPGAHPGYKPMAYGIFMSVGGGQNHISNNEFTIDQKEPPNDEQHGAYAFYIGGSSHGGIYHGNLVTSNVTPVWIGTMYGPAGNVVLDSNTFRRPDDAPPYVPLRLGWYKFPTRNVSLFSNRYEGIQPGVTIGDYTTGYTSEYDVGWTLTVRTVPGAEVVVLDARANEVFRQPADGDGRAVARLPQYHARGAGERIEDGKRVVNIEMTDVSAYTVRANGNEKAVTLRSDSELRM